MFIYKTRTTRPNYLTSVNFGDGSESCTWPSLESGSAEYDNDRGPSKTNVGEKNAVIGPFVRNVIIYKTRLRVRRRRLTDLKLTAASGYLMESVLRHHFKLVNPRGTRRACRGIRTCVCARVCIRVYACRRKIPSLNNGENL